MKANPDFKWHNPGKITETTSKPVTRPSNARVVVQTKRSSSGFAEQESDGGMEVQGHVVQGQGQEGEMYEDVNDNHPNSITTGKFKLADPVNMGGLNLLLAATQQGKSPPGGSTKQDNTDSKPNEALMELAEMCSSKLHHRDPKAADHLTATITNQMKTICMLSNDKDAVEMASVVQNQIARERFLNERKEYSLANVEGKKVVNSVIEQLYLSHQNGNLPSQETHFQQGESFFGNKANARCNDMNTNSHSNGISESLINNNVLSQSSMSLDVDSSESSQHSEAHAETENEASNKPPKMTFSDDQAGFCDELQGPQSSWSAMLFKTKSHELLSSIDGSTVQDKHSRRSWAAPERPQSSENLTPCPRAEDESPPLKLTRRRNMSESDKLDRARKYKTGTFDLEAQIASLPACSIDDLSRRRSKSFSLRKRHHSEGSKRHSYGELTIERASSLCDVKISTFAGGRLEPVAPSSLVGSQKRKARKTSITHLVPFGQTEEEEREKETGLTSILCNPNQTILKVPGAGSLRPGAAPLVAIPGANDQSLPSDDALTSKPGSSGGGKEDLTMVNVSTGIAEVH
ncbi:uncharacterized protein LOC106181162 isoform X2 [Lingula anatina]|nr:uncharacterized protein LOC106181162 isoform X2 [Lingula anatina]|eukprot:XP_013420920.1 uncharacterized protein LOC106181162 isoform X2 [Lingula anatina]